MTVFLIPAFLVLLLVFLLGAAAGVVFMDVRLQLYGWRRVSDAELRAVFPVAARHTLRILREGRQ